MNKTLDEKLAPCPFCGKRAKLEFIPVDESDTDYSGEPYEERWVIGCPDLQYLAKCPCPRIVTWKKEEIPHLINIWNTRPTPDNNKLAVAVKALHCIALLCIAWQR